MLQRRLFSSFSIVRHENPLGLPRRGPPPTMPRKGGFVKRSIPNVKKVLLVASGKGGVGKSTVAVNLAFYMAKHRASADASLKRVGILDLDIFGPSVPTLMGLQNSEEPSLTEGGGIIPIVNHGIQTMSMGYLLPRAPGTNDSTDVPIVWRGLMVQKAVQQLLFDVDWTNGDGGPGLDLLVVDMPPGTGDVPLTVGQLTKIDGSVIVSTPQDVSLSDVRKSIAMFRKISLPINGLLLNQSYFMCPNCTTPHQLFGSSSKIEDVAKHLELDLLGQLPLVPGVSAGGDQGTPYAIMSGAKQAEYEAVGGSQFRETFEKLAGRLWESL